MGEAKGSLSPARGGRPIHMKISEILIRDIAAGRLVDGSRLPPEREMAEEFDIAVGTLRRALGVLEREGLLERVQGSGNYIRANVPIDNTYAMLRLERVGGGGVPSAELLSVERHPPPDAAPFDVGSWRFRRLRFLDDVPAAMEEIWLDGRRALAIDAQNVSQSLYQFYREHLRLIIGTAVDEISVAAAPDWSDPRFGTPPGDAAGYIERVGYDMAGDAVEFSRTWFDPDRVRYVSRIGKG